MIEWPQVCPIVWNKTWSPEMLRLLEASPFNAVLHDDPSTELLQSAERRNIRVLKSTEIPAAPLSRLDARGAPVVIVRQSLWPGVRAFNENGAAAAGPTGSPWIDSNGWLVQVARAKAPGSAIWFAHQPPANRINSPAAYSLAVADAMAFGAKWVIAFDDSLAHALASAEPAALQTWQSIVTIARWFLSQAPEGGYPPVARLAVLSEFENPVVDDAVNLLARRQVPFLAALPQNVSRLLLSRMAAIYCDSFPPESLLQFAKSGGLLITPAPPSASAIACNPSASPRFRSCPVEKGAWAYSLSAPKDPYLLASDIHLLLSRREDLVRLWNAGTLYSYYREADDGTRATVDLVNYAGRVSNDEATLQIRAPYVAARWISPGAPPKNIDVRHVSSGIEVDLPKFPVCARVELSARKRSA